MTRWLAGPRRRTLVALALALVLLAALWMVRNALADSPLERLARVQGEGGHGQAWQGSIYFPRGGPYILGFESPNGQAALFIDGKRVIAGQGQTSTRVLYEAGIKAIRFEAPEGGRLLWHPPGRRGPLEYVPASSLAPDPPERARFGRWAGASPLDGLVSVLAVLIVAGACAYIWRGSLASVNRRELVWVLGTALLALAVRLHDLGAAGQTWDEDVNWSAGRNYVTNWLSLDFSASSWEWNYEHPPVMKYVAGIGAQWADGYGPARALSALMIAIACGIMVAIGRRLYGLRVGVLAGLVAGLSPHLIGHGKVVGHEAPTVLLWALAVWLCLRAHDGLSHGSPDGLVHDPADHSMKGSGVSETADPDAARRLAWRMAGIGVVFGLAVSSRFVNALMAPLIGGILLVRAPAGQRKRTLVLGLLIIAPVAALVGMAVWPRLWSEPITHLQEAWEKLRKPHSPEPFFGTITSTPPRHYFLVYLAATAPLGVLMGVLAFVARIVAWQGRERTTSIIVLLWLAVPLLAALSPVRQDGVRYIMPSLLALALMCAAGVDFLASLVARMRTSRSSTWVRAGLGMALVLYLGVVNARIHPYYLDYYGEHMGGPERVAKKRLLEVAWWGEGLAQAIEYVNRHAPPRARVHKQCVEPGHLAWLRADLFEAEARLVHEADWILVYQPSWRTCPLPNGARLVHEVAAQGAPLAHVYRVDR